MNLLLSGSNYWGVVATLFSYWIALKISQKWKHTLCNPLLISSCIMIFLLFFFKVDYRTYESSNKYLNYLLTPATVCLAIPMYNQLTILKKHLAAIFISILSGCLTCSCYIFILCKLFRLPETLFAALIPKSVTTAIALGISAELNGNTSITAVMVVITGLFGAIIAQGLLKFLRIFIPIAQGLAIGNSSHVVGTSKALEMGELQGAISSLSIAVAGILTVVLSPCIMRLY